MMRLFLMETSLKAPRKKVLLCQVKLQKRIKNAQEIKITVLACLGVQMRSPKTVISVIGYS